MLDKRTELVLYALNKKCGEGSYKVVEAGDILAQLPKKFKMDDEGLKDIIGFLCEREYIRCKYSEKSLYCLAPLPKGRLYSETRVKEKNIKKTGLWQAVLVLIAACAGGAAGAFLFMRFGAEVLL